MAKSEMKWERFNDKIVARYTPILIPREFTYEVECITSSDKVVDFKTATNGMRAWSTPQGPVMEKLCVDGKMRYIKFTPDHQGDLNFYNVGWDGPQGRRYLRVDVYTGEYAIIED